MPGKVIFTTDIEYETKRISELSLGFHRKFYVYSHCCTSTEEVRRFIPEFRFVSLKETFYPKNLDIFLENSDRDFFVIKLPRFSDIMDKDISAYQDVLKGYKLVVEEHPFMGKKDTYWTYFLWSFFDRSLLGYPHCYAFKGAKTKDGVNPLDPKVIATKVYSATETTIKKIFMDDIVVDRVVLPDFIKEQYDILKSELFSTENKQSSIISKLSNFVKSKEPILKKGFNLTDIRGVYNYYIKGVRNLYISDAKIDSYLEEEFWTYINNVNGFMEALWGLCGNK